MRNEPALFADAQRREPEAQRRYAAERGSLLRMHVAAVPDDACVGVCLFPKIAEVGALDFLEQCIFFRGKRNLSGQWSEWSGFLFALPDGAQSGGSSEGNAHARLDTSPEQFPAGYSRGPHSVHVENYNDPTGNAGIFIDDSCAGHLQRSA